MTPYYTGNNVVIWQGDSRELSVPSESVHLVVTSPPYNAGIPYDGSIDWLPWEDYWDGLVEPVLRECHRVLVDGGRIAVNIANMVRAPGIDQTNFCTPWGMMMAPAIWRTLTDIGFLPRDQVMWSKTGEPEDMPTTTAWGSWCSASNPVLRAIAEPIFIASKGSYAREKGRSDVTASEFKRWTRNLWSIQTDRHVDHPAPFPEELPRRLIKLYSYVGDTVLDPFCGSGTTVKVARDLRRNAIGVELSERYCRIAAGRCAQTMLPLMETA